MSIWTIECVFSTSLTWSSRKPTRKPTTTHVLKIHNGSFGTTLCGCDLRHPTGMVKENMDMSFVAWLCHSNPEQVLCANALLSICFKRSKIWEPFQRQLLLLITLSFNLPTNLPSKKSKSWQGMASVFPARFTSWRKSGTLTWSTWKVFDQKETKRRAPQLCGAICNVLFFGSAPPMSLLIRSAKSGVFTKDCPIARYVVTESLAIAHRGQRIQHSVLR